MLLAIFVAFNWRMVSNLAAVLGDANSELADCTPAQIVKGCPADKFPIRKGALGTDTFAAMQACADKHSGTGLVVLVDGAIAGEASREEADATTRSQSQNMHKSMLVLIMGAAIDDRSIGSLDDPVGKYPTEWQGERRGQISLRQLLSTSSGLHNASMSAGDLTALDTMFGDVSEAALSLEP